MIDKDTSDIDLLLADRDYHNQLLAKLDPRIAEEEHFFVAVGYSDALKGHSQ